MESHASLAEFVLTSELGRLVSYLPSAFSMTLAVLPSMTATQEFVVPKSIPMMLQKG